MENKNIIIWEEKFNKYLELEKECSKNINLINDVKNNLKKLLGNQKSDDLIFYKSLIENTYFYLFQSLKIRKIKLLNDLNFIWKMMDERKKCEEISSHNFNLLLQDYIKICRDNELAKKNNTSLKWVKDDNLKNINELEIMIGEVLDYHNKILEFFNSIVNMEKEFYCSKE